MVKNMFFNLRNLVIAVIGGVFTYLYMEYFGFNFKPLLFIGIIYILSIAYSGIFDKYKDAISKKVDELIGKPKEFEVIESYVLDIEKAIKAIKVKSKTNINFMIISRFMDEITEVESILPKLVENYKKGLSYLNKNSGMVEREIQSVEKKLSKAKGTAKQTYEKALQEKYLTINEIENIKTSLDETESRFQYILSTLQKIEALMQSSELGQVLSDEDTRNFNIEFEAFTDVIRETSRKVKL